jgi:drug/metabolite transporter (DMT)-like permease
MFATAATLIGVNFVAIKITLTEVGPLWSATLRFVMAAGLFVAWMRGRAMALPRGRTLLGIAGFGALNIGAFFALVNWGLQGLPAATAGILLASMPLFTFLASWAHGLEGFSWHRIAGATIAIAGIVWLSAGEVSAGVSLLRLFAVLAAAALAGEATVILRLVPPVDPVATNAVAVTTGATLLLIMTVVSGESMRWPAQIGTWGALVFLAVVGTLAVFWLFVSLIQRWTPASTAYVLVVAPYVAAVAAYIWFREPIGWTIVGSAALVGIGVYVGAVRAPARPGRRIARQASKSI